MNQSPTPAEPAVSEDARFSRTLDDVLADFFSDQHRVVEAISPEATALVDSVERLTSGGKRLRARLCYWGWRAAGGEELATPVVRAAAALELFQSAALIHDDILDRSDTRRGRPSVHRQFQATHAREHWRDDAAHFGVSAAVLVGDLSLSFAEQLFASATALCAPEPGLAARAVFDTMRTEVMVGQYLDVHAEVAPTPPDPEDQLRRALAVLRYKSAKYSVEHPVTIGAALGGATPEFVAHCSAFALPVGEAFQLRDDVLGVFGDPTTTGKPAGDDIREGKRTALVALCARGATADEIEWLESVLGRADLSEADVQRARELMDSSGALAHTERLISELVTTANAELAALDTTSKARAGLQRLVDAAVRRSR